MTYVHAHLGATEVLANDGKLSGTLPLGLVLLGLTSTEEGDLPVSIIDDLTDGIKGGLVVGEGVGALAVAVVELELDVSLLDLAGGEGVTLLDVLVNPFDFLKLGLVLEGNILYHMKRPEAATLRVRHRISSLK